jgi:hypothetical protein
MTSIESLTPPPERMESYRRAIDVGAVRDDIDTLYMVRELYTWAMELKQELDMLQTLMRARRRST